MYPALILVIVNKEHSIVNTFGFNTALGNNLNIDGDPKNTDHPATIGCLVFASPLANRSVDNEQSLSASFTLVGPEAVIHA